MQEVSATTTGASMMREPTAIDNISAVMTILTMTGGSLFPVDDLAVQ